MRASARTIEILIDSALNPEGFEQAKNAISGVALKANEFDYLLGQTYTSLSKTADAGKGLGRDLGGARGPVADLTRVLLSQIGASQGAGEAAKVAGIGMLFMDGAASGLSLSFAAATASVAFFLPLLISLAGASEDAGQKGKQASDSFGGLLSRLQDLESQAGLTSPKLKELLSLLRTEEHKSQADELKGLTDQYAALAKQVRALEDPVLRSSLVHGLPGALEDNEKKAAALREQMGALAVKARALEDAMLDGTSVAGELKSEEDALALTKKKVQEATEQQKKAQEDLNKAFDEGRAGQLESVLRDLAPLIEHDSAALAELEKHAKLGALTPELFEALTTAPNPDDIEETGAALRRLGVDLGAIAGDTEDVGLAFQEVQQLLDAGIVTPPMAEKINRQLLGVIDNLRSFGVAVQSPFSAAEESVIALTQTIEDQAVPAASQLIDTLVAGATGTKIAWDDFFRSMIRNFIAAILKAVILRGIMRAIGLAGGGVVGSASGIDAASPGGLGAVAPGVGVGAGGGQVMGGIPGLDSVRALLMPGEIVLPVPIAEDFLEITAMAHQARQAQAGRALDLRPTLSMPINILPQPDRQRDAIELLDEINTLVERRGYRLVASEALR